MSASDSQLRLATLQDADDIETLITDSCRVLARSYHSPAVIEAALQSAWGLDSQLILDGSYFVIEGTQGRLLACGGWSHRKTLFGGNAEPGRNPEPLDPRHAAAKIRAFFVNPDAARQGLASRLMTACEQAARAAGFTRLELMSTLAGLPFYRHHGFIAGEPVHYPLPNGETIEFVPMQKTLA